MRRLWVECPGGPQIDLAGPRAGSQGVALLEGFDYGALFMPPSELITSAAAAQVGSTPRAFREHEREVPLLVGTRGPDSRAHARVEALWWSVWRPRRLAEPTRLWSAADHETRYLDLWFSKVRTSTETGLSPDAYGNHFLQHDMTTVAARPAWRSPTQVLAPDGGSGRRGFRITNDSDRDLWPTFVGEPGVWEIQDGLGGRFLEFEFTERWKMWTDPTVPSVEYESGPAPLSVMNGRTFTTPIPAGTYDAELEVSGAGEIRCEVVVEHSRPWG